MEGDNEGNRLTGSSLTDDGEAWSGLAIRSPPRDCDKLRSPFMLEEEAHKGISEEGGRPVT